MQVSYSPTPPAGHTLTITFTTEEDPQAILADMGNTTHLKSFLLALAQNGYLGGAVTRRRILDLIRDTAWCADRGQEALYGLAVRGRDQYGLGWGTIATELNLSRSTTRDRISRIRLALASSRGIYIDRSGVHQATPQRAVQAAAHRTRVEQGAI